MSFYIATSGSLSVNSMVDYVQVYPEYNYELTGKKIEDRKRSRAGKEYVYKWSQYKGWKFDIFYVNCADMTKINSWWSGNDTLIFIDNLSQVNTVRLTNDKTPISKFEKPYTDLWSGMIELENF